jgi:hypothetical protein
MHIIISEHLYKHNIGFAQGPDIASYPECDVCDATGTQFTCFTGKKVQLLTQLRLRRANLWPIC